MVIFVLVMILMKLHLQRDISSGDVRFLVYDESGNEKYRAVPVSTRVTKRTNLVLLDSRGEPAAKIRRLPIVSTYSFVLKVKKTHITFVIVPTKNGILSYFYGNNWHINGSIAASDIDDALVSQHMATADMPDPDLLIRTGGDLRVSNYLLWQIAYSELYFTSKYWPDFTKEDFVDAIIDFQARERRYGKTSEQVNN